MDNDSFQLNETCIGENCAPAAAIAAAPYPLAGTVNKPDGPTVEVGALISALAGLDALATVIDGTLLPPPNVQDAVSPEWHEPLMTLVTDSLRRIVIAKNVNVLPDAVPPLAHYTLGQLDAVTLTGITQGDDAAIACVRAQINYCLDLVAGMQFLIVLWQFEGFTEFTGATFNVVADAWLRERIANDVTDHRRRWPDIVEMISAYYRARSGAGVSIQMPEDQPSRVSLFLDRTACRKPATGEGAQSLLPLVIRCPGLPGKFLPDGKQTVTLPDSCTRTAWWLNGQLHRDPQEGPAVRILDVPTGDPIREEYHYHGKLHRVGGPAFVGYREDGSLSMASWYRDGKHHREPEDGPACIYDRSDGSRSEEYFVEGRYHRNPASGPAFIKRNADGEIVIQLYWVNGDVHRDPADGPARTVIDGEVEETEYYQGGQRHREDGPAVIHRDLVTGEVLKAEYWLHDEQIEASVEGESS